MTPLESAKARFCVTDLWTLLGLPGKPPRTGSASHSPFREDRRPSFSIFDGGRAFKDHATGEAGDVVDFLGIARGCSKSDAARELIALAGSPRPFLAPPPSRRVPPPSSPAPASEGPAARGPALPADLAAPTAAELAAIAKLRRLPNTEGLEAAAAAGHLFVGMLPDLREVAADVWHRVRVWIVTDSTRRNAQARRMDGQPWHCLGMAKARTLRGSAASWPIGAAETENWDRVLVAEGGPDFLCLWHLIVTGCAHDCTPVAMLGASQSIHPDAAEYFVGKTVTLFPHLDTAGTAAREAWAAQFYAAGARTVEFYDLAPLFAGRPGKDLNDLLSLEIRQ